MEKDKSKSERSSARGRLSKKEKVHEEVSARESQCKK